MKRKFSDTFPDNGGHTEKVQRLLQHRTETIETLAWHEGRASATISEEADLDLRKVIDNFISLYEHLDQTDDIDIKPNYSYTELIYLAILRAPNFCLPINEIYRYIKHRFSFFRHSTREHWKNAVRHSLSKTKCFTKINPGRLAGQTGGCSRSTFLWTIVPSSLVAFAKGDYRSNIDCESDTNTLRFGYYRLNVGQFLDRVALALVRKVETFKQSLFVSCEPGKLFRKQMCDLTAKTSSDDTPSDQTSTTSIDKLTNQLPPIVPVEPQTMHHHNSPPSVINGSAFSTPINDSGYGTTFESSPEYVSSGCRINAYNSANLNSSYIGIGFTANPPSPPSTQIQPVYLPTYASPDMVAKDVAEYGAGYPTMSTPLQPSFTHQYNFINRHHNFNTHNPWFNTSFADVEQTNHLAARACYQDCLHSDRTSNNCSDIFTYRPHYNSDEVIGSTDYSF